MNKRSQLSFEYLIMVSIGVIIITLTTIYVNSIINDREVEHGVRSLLSEVSDAAETVALMGYPARQTFTAYVPKYLDENSSYVKNNTVNYGVHQQYTGIRDVFEVFDFCVKGNLPVYEGYYVINVLALEDCVLIDYQDFYVNPTSVNRTFPVNVNITVNFDIINLLIGPANMTITANGSISAITDLDTSTPGRQDYFNLGELSDGEFYFLPVVFYGDSEGVYTGSLYFNSIEVPVWLNVSEIAYYPPSIIDVQTNTTSAGIDDYACFNATIVQGTESINSVWVELGEPFSCWELGGGCDSSCQYNSIASNNYYNDPGCAASCPVSGTFYTVSGSCSIDGSGNCYAGVTAVNRNTTCTQGPSCGNTCSGTPTPCASHTTYCTYCGCDYENSGPGVDKWTEDFSSSNDWSSWSFWGIDYVNDASNCVNDANDDCLRADGFFSDYYLYKQSSEDLSNCESGSAWFYIGHVKENGNLEGNDCMYVAFSNNGGSTWSSNYEIFCNDNPSSTFNMTIPNSYLTNDFRIRIRKRNILASFFSIEEAWLDDFKVHCVESGSGCTGIPNNCNTYTNSTACSNCGCTWSTTAWNWTLAGLTSGYSSYSTCTWETNSQTPNNITLYDTGAWCAGVAGDGVYGVSYQLNSEGVYTLIAGYVNDTTGYTDFYTAGIDINVTTTGGGGAYTNTTIFFEDFTPSPYYEYNWTRQGTDWDSNSGGNCYGGSGYCAHADHNCDEANDWIATNAGLLDLSTASNAYVDLYVREDTSFDSGDYFRVWCWNGGNWVKIYQEDAGDWNNNGAWNHREFLTDNACLISNARYRITIISNHPHEDVYVDDFRVIMES